MWSEFQCLYPLEVQHDYGSLKTATRPPPLPTVPNNSGRVLLQGGPAVAVPYPGVTSSFATSSLCSLFRSRTPLQLLCRYCAAVSRIAPDDIQRGTSAAAAHSPLPSRDSYPSVRPWFKLTTSPLLALPVVPLALQLLCRYCAVVLQAPSR